MDRSVIVRNGEKRPPLTPAHGNTSPQLIAPRAETNTGSEFAGSICRGKRGVVDGRQLTITRHLPFLGRRLLAAEAERQAGRPIRHPRWVRVRLACEELGPTFVKLGQFLSSRPDLLPRELCRELAGLLDAVAPFDSREARRVVEGELSSQLDEVFMEFSPEPMSSASIAQVHRARLRDGSAVAVKVQRPGIQKTIASDVEIIRHIAALMERHAFMPFGW